MAKQRRNARHSARRGEAAYQTGRAVIRSGATSAQLGEASARNRARRSPFHAAGRPIAWSALISAVVLSIAVGPAYAAPAGNLLAPLPQAIPVDGSTTGQIPDSGTRPTVVGTLQLPGLPSTTPTLLPALSTLAQQLTAKQTELERAGEELKEFKLDHGAMRTNLAQADREWRDAADQLKKAQEQADTDAAEAFKAAAAMPPGISTLGGLDALSIVPGNDPHGEGSARDVLRAQEEERAKFDAYSAAIKAEEDRANQIVAAQANYQRLEQEYLALRQQNADQLAAIEQEREALEQSQGTQYIGNGSLNGYAANAKAMAAVYMALNQLGKPYVWGAEGPSSFDCSGLMWYSYHHGAGYNLPRVAKDQYYATRAKTVSRYDLLPGDLIFFATNPNDWTTVHHVGMYIGGGKMVHAPNTGDVVKISSVWWSEFFAATRVFSEVKAPGGSSTPTTPPPSSTPPGSTPPGSTPPGSTPPGTTPPGSTPPSSLPPGSGPSKPPVMPSKTPSAPPETPSDPPQTSSGPTPAETPTGETTSGSGSDTTSTPAETGSVPATP